MCDIRLYILNERTLKMAKQFDEFDEWDEIYGDDSDDGYDARRDFGGDIDEARRSFDEED